MTKTPEYGGAERHLQELIRRIDNPAVRVTVLCYGPDFYSKYFERQSNVRVIAREGGEPRGFFSYWLSFFQARPDTIVLIKGWAEEFSLHVYLAARACGAKRLVAIEHLLANPAPPDVPGHGLTRCFRKAFGWRARFLMNKRLQGVLCTTTICVSDGVLKRLIAEYYYPAARTITILNGVDLKRFCPANPVERQEFRASLGIGPDQTVVVCACRLSARKRIDVLLHSLAMLPKDIPAWKCWIIGTGPQEQEVRELAVSLGLNGLVRFFGFQEDPDRFLKGGDIYVSSSDREGFGLSLVEAMACKLPCIATDIPGHDEIVVPGHNGMLVRAGSPERLAEAAARLIGSPEERLRMGENARKRAEQCFDIEDCMRKIRGILEAKDSA